MAKIKKSIKRTLMSPLIIRSLKYRNFRLFFGGQTISLIGTWMTQVTTSWLVYRLTHSAFLLGLVGFTGQIPVFLFSAFAGVWIDRLNLRRILMVTQVLAMVQSLTLAFLTLTNRITVVEIIALGFFQGLINVFDMPTRQAFVVQMVDNKQDLGNAIALNSFMVNVARLIGPMLAGIIIAKMGEGTCFLIDGLSYIPVILSLLLMILPLHRPLIPPPGIFHQLKEGARYAFGFLPIRNVLFLMALLSLTGMSLNVLMPIFAVQIFNGDSHILGFLLSASGIGALVGAIVLASKKTVLGLTRIMVMTGCLLGVGMILFSFSRNFWLSLFSLGITGLCLIMIIASINTFLQTIVEDNKRGRLMSLFTIAFIGMAPFGSLLAGGLAKYLGAPYTLLINGSCCILGTLIFSRSLPSLRRLVKPIYIEKGIL